MTGTKVRGRVENPTPIMEAMRNMMADDLKEDSWDEAPALFLFAWNAKEGALGALNMDVPTEVWEAGHPVDIVRMITKGIKLSVATRGNARPPRFSPPEGFEIIAAALFCEGWGVSSDKDTVEREPVRLIEQIEAAENHTIHLRDDKVETKMLNAVDLGGHEYALSYARGNYETPMFEVDMDDSDQFTGRVSECLAEFLLTVVEEFAA